jgi:hypothetical protein
MPNRCADTKPLNVIQYYSAYRHTLHAHWCRIQYNRLDVSHIGSYTNTAAVVVAGAAAAAAAASVLKG